MAATRSRRHLWRCVPAPGRQHGHRRSDLRSVQPMAKSVCGEIDRIHQARVPEPRHRPRRAPSATSADRVSHLLSWGANTSRPGEGRTDATTCSDADGGSRRRVPGSGRIASSLRTTRRLTRLGPTWRRRNRAVTSVCAARPRVRFPRRFNAIMIVMASPAEASTACPDRSALDRCDFGERHRPCSVL